MKKWLKVVVIVLVVIVVLVVSLLAALFLDLTSYGATGSETLTPASASIGKALVVYDPGFSGAAKQDATIVADDLQSKGYTVDLAGVRSGVAGNSSGYNIIVAGGPIYWGQVSGSVDGYLKTLPNNAKLGVFGSTGSSSFAQSDFVSLQNQITSDTHNEKVAIKLILAGNETNDCAALVSSLLQQG